MGKFKFIVLATLTCILVGCSKESNTPEYYTENQKSVFEVLDGVWRDTQFATTNNGIVNCAQIRFSAAYQTPKGVANGESYIYTRHGDCTFVQQYNQVITDQFDCGFYVSPNGKTLDLHLNSDNSLFHYYTITIVNNDMIYLHQNGLSLPYIFVRGNTDTK